MIIGLTGGIGAGKSTVLNIFKDLGIPTINADDISKDIVAHNDYVFKQIIDKFKKRCVDEKNHLDKKKLRHIIFDSQHDREWLENLLHPLIKQKIAEFAQHNSNPYCVIEIPLLFEAKWQDTVDRILNIDCQEKVQIDRLMQRDNNNRAEARAILNSQTTREIRNKGSHDIIENNYDLDSLKQQVLQLHEKYLRLASKPID